MQVSYGDEGQPYLDSISLAGSPPVAECETNRSVWQMGRKRAKERFHFAWADDQNGKLSVMHV